MEKTVLVTGVSSGIGRATAALLATKGFRVFGTVRGELAGPPVNVELVQCDVRDDYAVNHAVDGIIERAGPIDVLVNNAGYALLGAVEETTVAQAEEIVDANFFGVMRLTNALLPFMRQRGWGRIVNIGSVMGFLPAPYMGIYAATKHALTAYSETLDHEVRRFGVRSIVIEPGFVRTQIRRNSRTAEGLLAVYAREACEARNTVEKRIDNGLPAETVARTVWKAIRAGSPRSRYRVGTEAKVLALLRRFLPAFAFDLGLRRQFRLDSRG